MALFIGGPADGWRIEVDTRLDTVTVPINPHPPAFTPDSAVLSASSAPAYTYKRETLTCALEEYFVYIPSDWNCSDLVEALIMGYKPENNYERTRYTRTAEGKLYDNDDRLTGRIYRV